jgi:hypothetical protein
MAAIPFFPTSDAMRRGTFDATIGSLCARANSMIGR